MNTTQPLTEDDLDELDAFLMSDEMPEEGMDISTLDGFLAAIVLNPNMIMPSQWLPWVWDMDNAEESPEFASIEEASRISGYIMRHYNMALLSIDGGWFEPLLFSLAQPDGSEFYDAEGWCAGFMLGVSMFPDIWQPVLENYPEMIGPMVLLGTEDGWDILESGGDNKRATQEAYESIPAAVAGLHAYFKPQQDWLPTRASREPGIPSPQKQCCHSSAARKKLDATTRVPAVRARNSRNAAVL